ncbi:MAG TPA: DsrE/DsrF/DrsH-like family protein [Solirubrobacteraceae bacterium]|nr:DsrE/DsrF/DrsH-like family protein [Solirubrobacteraceae bacterium]
MHLERRTRDDRSTHSCAGRPAASRDREGVDHHLQGLVGGDLPRSDHGQRRAHGGLDANLFFTFFGMDAINQAKHEHVKVATVGNPGLHLATWAGGVPGISALVTHKLAQEMEKLDIPPIPEFVEMIADSGAGLYACKASVDLFGLSRDDFIAQVRDIITVGEFYGLAAGGQIIFT